MNKKIIFTCCGGCSLMLSTSMALLSAEFEPMIFVMEPDLENESSSITSSMGRIDKDLPVLLSESGLLLKAVLPLGVVAALAAAAAAAACAATTFCCCSAIVFSIKCLRRGRISDDSEHLTCICFEAPVAETELAGGECPPTTLVCCLKIERTH